MAGRRAVLIAGPTASGKSALALRLAERLGGVVINADAMAVYRDLSILTGRPDAADLARAPHRLYGHRDAAAPSSVGLWLGEAAAAIAEARVRGLVPIVAGGTGLFFKALTQGISDIPGVPEAVRRQVRAEAEGEAPEALHARLASLDPLTAAKLRPSDPQRILRALEVLVATGRPLAEFQGRRSAPALAEDEWLGIALRPDRAALRSVIDARFDSMMEAGALGEVERLAARKLDPALPVLRAHGVPPLMAHLGGTLTLADAVARAKADTRAYAKRQDTFNRHQLPGFAAALPQDAEATLARISSPRPDP